MYKKKLNVARKGVHRSRERSSRLGRLVRVFADAESKSRRCRQARKVFADAEKGQGGLAGL